MDTASTEWAFDKAIEHTLSPDVEGGYVNDPDDPGGATNFGVSLRWLHSIGDLDLDEDGFHDFDFDQDGDVDALDIQAMPRDRAVWVYHEFWWKKFRYDLLPGEVAIKVFDLSVNMGARQAHKLLQRALRAAGAEVVDDGLIGPATRRAIDDTDLCALLPALRSEAAGFYRALTAAKPPLKKFLNGWLRRAYS